MDTIDYADFAKLDIRCGTILAAKPFPTARKPAYQLEIDFGPLGLRKSSAQITRHYEAQNLVGRQVLAVVNFPPKQIANFMSECLVLGTIGPSEAGQLPDVVLLQPERPVPNGYAVS